MSKNNNNNKILLIQSLDLETAQKVSTCPGKTQPGENSVFQFAAPALHSVLNWNYSGGHISWHK